MSDVLRPEAEDMVKHLHAIDTNIVLLTGDGVVASYLIKLPRIKLS